MKVWLNGELVDREKARISPFDRGFLLGDGVFETLRAYRGRAHALDAHLERLHRSARLTRLPEPDVDAVREAVAAVLTSNGLEDGVVRITLTRGEGGRGVSPRGAGPSTLLVTAAPVPYGPDVYERGVHLVRAAVQKMPPEVLDPRVKGITYLPHVIARAEAEAQGADDALLLDRDGHVCEATTANLFLVTDGGLVTPSLASGCLDGITRAEVLQLARGAGIHVEERPVAPEEVALADEVFLTASVAEVLPVRAFDDAPVGDGRPGPLARRMHKFYRKHVFQGVATGP